jgi:hypothetical protein
MLPIEAIVGLLLREDAGGVPGNNPDSHETIASEMGGVEPKSNLSSNTARRGDCDPMGGDILPTVPP